MFSEKTLQKVSKITFMKRNNVLLLNKYWQREGCRVVQLLRTKPKSIEPKARIVNKSQLFFAILGDTSSLAIRLAW
jgi:hypothetical protein